MTSSPLPRRTLLAWTGAAGLGGLMAQPLAAQAAQATKHRHRHAAAKAAADAPAAAATGQAYGLRDDVRRLAAGLAGQHGIDAEWAQATLAQARFVPAVARLIMPPPKGSVKNWAAYRARFIEPERIRAGAAFWAANAAWLATAEDVFGVPPEAVVGIIGVETFYGRVMGNFRVLDALATLSLDFPTGRSDRSGFFQQQLGEFLVWVQREKRDPLAIKGSFAGAVGLGQFMPGSINQFAVDFDGDGRIDLANSTADAIGSVARYLKAHGWRSAEPTHFSVDPPTDMAERALLLAPDILPSFDRGQMLQHGARLPEAARDYEGLLALVELQNGGGAPTYFAGTQNFYAITRYNWSAYYAMAVIELGAAIAAERAKGVKTAR